MAFWTTAVFCDFDGTVTQRDVGYSIFHRFSGGANDALLPDWKAGKMTSRDILRKEAAMVRVVPGEFYSFLGQFQLTDGFLEFERLCHKNQVPLCIASDGFDLYIDYLLKRFNLGHIPMTANRARLENGGLSIEFPFQNVSCRRCGSCKGERIREFRALNRNRGRVVFVGDGYSDICAVPEADVVFAKKDLEKYCRQNDIAYRSFGTFFDVARHMIEDGYLEP